MKGEQLGLEPIASSLITEGPFCARLSLGSRRHVRAAGLCLDPLGGPNSAPQCNNLLLPVNI